MVNCSKVEGSRQKERGAIPVKEVTSLLCTDGSISELLLFLFHPSERERDRER